MTKTTAVALTAFLFWPTAGWLAFLIIFMWLGSADKAPMGLQIIAGVTLLCAVALLAVPVYCALYLVSPVSMGGAASGKKKQSALVEDEEAGQESFADDSFEDDGEQLEVEEDDFSGSATNEFETLEFSGDDMDFGEDFALDDDEDAPPKKKKN